jgi:hypothetical protein
MKLPVFSFEALVSISNSRLHSGQDLRRYFMPGDFINFRIWKEIYWRSSSERLLTTSFLFVVAGSVLILARNIHAFIIRKLFAMNYQEYCISERFINLDRHVNTWVDKCTT